MLDQNVQSKIDALFAGYDQTDTPGCALGIVRGGELIYSKGYGMANLEHGIPLTPKSVFSLASVSKQFTAMCIALLEEAGKLHLDDDIRQYLPELPEYPEKITIGNLVYMTDGLRCLYSIENYIKGSPDDVVLTKDQAFQNALQIRESFFTPGERYSYSNTAYFLLAQIVERVSGLTLARYAQEQIFQPLGMKNTFFREDHSQLIPNRAQGYCKYEHSHYTDVLRSKYRSHLSPYALATDNTESPGAGQVWSTVEDLHLWVKNFADNKLGRGEQSLIDRVTTPGKLNDGTEVCYGYGQFLSERKKRKVVYHEGGGIGENTVVYMLPEEHLAVICLSNTNYFLGDFYRKHNYVDLAEFITDYILDEDDAEKAQTQGSSHRPDDQQAQHTEADLSIEFSHVLGEYQNPATSSIWQVIAEDQQLVVVQNFLGRQKLEPLGAGKFKIKGSQSICTFDQDETGETSKLLVENGEKVAHFLPFISPLDEKMLEEYLGEYRCSELDTTYHLTLKDGALYMYNKNRTKYGLDLTYLPSIQDSFYSHTPPYVPDHLTITFQRDAEGQVEKFVFRDYDLHGREVYQFIKL